MLRANLIIDGNYILNKLVFTLSKTNQLFGMLDAGLNQLIFNYKKLYPFTHIYLVSDSSDSSWRKSIYAEYKASRKKDTTIDWEFVFNTYTEFKTNVKQNGVKVMETSTVEGDDWINYLINKSNEMGVATVTISNDHDITQLMKFSLTDNWINIMYNDMHLGRRLFLPNNYKIMLQKFKRDENDLFSDDDFELFTNLLNTLTTNSQIVEVDPTKSIFVKIISGDTSDNIKTVYSTKTANGKNRGIGVAGANSLYVKYVTEFGDMDLNDPDFNDNAKDLIKELRKLSNSDLPKIVENLNLNRKLIELDLKNLPNNLLLQMNKHYEKEHNKHIIQTTFSPI